MQTGTHQKSETGNKHRNKELEERISVPAEAATDWPKDAFAQWYALYPKRKQRKAAEKAFGKLQRSGEIDLEGLLSVTRRHAHAMRTVDQQFIPYPATWLNNGSYLDEEDKPKGNGSAIAKPEIKPSDFTEADWRTRLKAHHESGSPWPEQHWGPKPGEPGCLVPRHLLVAPVKQSRGLE
jgi:hypothetical protein